MYYMTVKGRNKSRPDQNNMIITQVAVDLGFHKSIADFNQNSIHNILYTSLTKFKLIKEQYIYFQFKNLSTFIAEK